MTDGKPARSAGELADALVGFATGQLEALQARQAPRFALPRVFAGHLVGPDARSDLAFTLGLLAEAGVGEIGGTPLGPVVLATLRGLDGSATHTFYSYRAAESLLRFGGWDDNPLLETWSDAERANLREAFDSSSAATELGKGRLPINFAVVLARCEYARQRLGLLGDAALLEGLLVSCTELFGSAAEGWIDDSHERRGQFDIYTPDMFLFAEPLAERLGAVWSEGLRRVLDDVEDLALPGGAIVWGRSVGALGLAMSIELAAIGAARDLSEKPGAALARGSWALDELRRWFSDGLIRAHQHRSPMFYRGPARRLQMSLDVLGKLVQAALDLRKVAALEVGPPFEAWGQTDRMIALGRSAAGVDAAAWSHRQRRLSFVLPLVDGWSSEYLPAPRAPGLFETAVAGPISLVPVVHHAGKALVAGNLPVSIRHGPGRLETVHEGFAEVASGGDAEPVLVGRRRACFRVQGRTLIVDEELELSVEPTEIDAVSLQVPSLADRPLDVCFETEHPHATARIDVSGLAEWRSFWSELATVDQIDLEPARALRFRWSVTPQLRIGSTARGHPYDDALYAPLAGRLRARLAVPDAVDRPLRLAATDVLHMHWPEWWQGMDLERNRAAIDALHAAGVKIVWTQHNLLPHHDRGPQGEALYALWAAAADAVIHHTEWGRERALAAYAYREDALHRTIPHGHWGHRAALHALVPRAHVEAELGLSACALRLGVVGAPRAEKDVQLVLDAFHACGRDDLQLLVLSLDGESVPEDRRITALPSRHEPEHVYYQRLNAIDAIVYPFAPSGMLMTGTALDAIGAGKAAVVSDWPLLHEVFGEAAIAYGASREELTACFEALTPERVEASAAAIEGLRGRTDWTRIAAETLELLEDVAARD